MLTLLKGDKSVRGDTRAKIAGLALKADDAVTYVALSLVHTIFEPCEMVATALQSPKITAQGASSQISLLKSRLLKLREGALETETAEAVERAEALGLMPASNKRQTKTPARIRHDSELSVDMQLHPTTTARTGALEALDLVIAQLDERFNTPGLKLAALREQVLLRGLDNARHQLSSEELAALQLPANICSDRLRCQLAVFAHSFEEAPTSPAEVFEKLQSMDASSLKMFADVLKV